MAIEETAPETATATGNAATAAESTPIAEYGMLADCNSAAHVSRAGG